MKLKDLSSIRFGAKLPQNLLLSVKPSNSNPLFVVQAANFTSSATGKFIVEKELKKVFKGSYRSFLLEYGNYLLVQDKEKNTVRIFRHEQIGGQYIAADDVIILGDTASIIENYLGFENNRNYVCSEIQKGFNNGKEDILKLIGDIEINTDYIRELEEDNKAEELGIRAPLEGALPAINQKPFPLDLILRKVERGEIVLDTEFQRRPDLWNNVTKSRFIEALIARIPIPAFYFDCADEDKWQIIDGLQRISTVVAFKKGEFYLEKLDFFPKIEGKRYDDLERGYQRNIEDYTIMIYQLEANIPPAVKYKIFKNINTAALVLEPQEIRHALNPDKPAITLKQISERDWFRRGVPLTDNQISRMYNREVVLRYIATQEFRIDYTPTIVEFLDESMYKMYKIPSAKLSIYEQTLKDILSEIKTVFGEPPFGRSYFGVANSYRHNNILFELITYAFSKSSRLTANTAQTKQDFIDYFSNQEDSFWDTETAYSKEGFHKRFDEMEKLIKNLK